MKRCLGIFISICAGSLFCSSARADVIYSINPASISASAGDTGDSFDVVVTNTGPDLSINGFAFEVSVADTDITLTGADFSTSAFSYIFAGDSFDQIGGFTLDFPALVTSPQQLDASDITNDGAGITLASGASADLGRVLFNVANPAASGPFAVSFTGNVDGVVGDSNNLSDASFNSVSVNVFNGGTITVGGGASGVPEPSSFFLALGAMAAMAGLRTRLRPRAKR